MFQEIVFGDIRNANISNISSLLKQGVDPNIYNKKGLHPLWRAAYHNRSDFVELLVQYGAVVDLPTNNKFGDTALIGAAQEGYVECATILLKYGANVNYLSKKGCTALYYACRYGHANIVNLLLDKGANIDKGTFLPLYGASQGGLLAIVEVLVSRGAGIDKPCDTQIASTPLTIACGNNHLEVAHFLICKGANVNYQTKSGFSSLHFASQNGHRAVVQLLIKSQARLDIKDNDGDSPLDMARRHGHSEIVSLLERADHTIPSGHILTKQELQVLGALLVTYSDERLKSIQISLQEEQEIRDISREEVEKSLRQNGLASIANALKDNIEKVTKDDSGYHAKCVTNRVNFNLKDRHLIWFKDRNSSKSSSTTDVQSECAHDECDGSKVVSDIDQIPLVNSSGSDKLKITDLHRIQILTWDARSQWYNVGLGLGISPDTLDAVKRDNRDICTDCYGAMLKQWLKEEPALSSLAQALRSPSVNMGYLTEELMSMEL